MDLLRARRWKQSTGQVHVTSPIMMCYSQLRGSVWKVTGTAHLLVPEFQRASDESLESQNLSQHLSEPFKCLHSARENLESCIKYWNTSLPFQNTSECDLSRFTYTNWPEHSRCQLFKKKKTKSLRPPTIEITVYPNIYLPLKNNNVKIKANSLENTRQAFQNRSKF